MSGDPDMNKEDAVALTLGSRLPFGVERMSAETATGEIVTGGDGHVWWTQSSHRTSEGVLRYQRCPCGVWRVLVGSGRVVVDHVGASATTTGH